MTTWICPDIHIDLYILDNEGTLMIHSSIIYNQNNRVNFLLFHSVLFLFNQRGRQVALTLIIPFIIIK